MRSIRGELYVRMYVRMDERTYGRLEIRPCVLQDIGPLGPLPKKSVCPRSLYLALPAVTVGCVDMQKVLRSDHHYHQGVLEH